MSAFSDFMTESSFWWGAGAGTVVAGTISAGIAAFSLRSSDRRKAAQEDKVTALKLNHDCQLAEERRAHEVELEKLKRQLDNEIEENRRAAEGKKEYDKLVLEAATTYAQTCSVALDEALDTDGLFNLVKDAFDTAAGLPDENAARKILFAADQTRNLKALARAFNSLQMVAPPEVLTPATRLNAAMAALLQTVTEPLAKALAFKSATDELKQFIDAFRAYIGYAPYTAEDAKRDAVSFVETLRQQVNQYVMRAKEEFRAAGFSTTPWD